MGTCFPKAFDSANEDGVKERRSSWLSSKALFPGSLFYTQKTWNENYALKRPLVTLTVQSRQAGFTSSLARSSQVFSLLSSSSQLHSTAHMLSRVAFSLLCSDCSDRMNRWAYSIAAELLALPLSVSLSKKTKTNESQVFSMAFDHHIHTLWSENIYSYKWSKWSSDQQWRCTH